MKNSVTPSVLVCVTMQHDCKRLILAGREIAEKKNLKLHVLSIFKEDCDYEKTSGEIESLYTASVDQGAEMTILFSGNQPVAAAAFAKKVGAEHIVTGMPGEQLSIFIGVLHQLTPDVPLSMVTKQNVVYNMYPSLACPEHA